jgi:hypothetical protein
MISTTISTDLTHPYIVVDSRGWLHVVTAKSMDALLYLRSTNNGVSWDEYVLISTCATCDCLVRWVNNPQISVDESDIIHIVFEARICVGGDLRFESVYHIESPTGDPGTWTDPPYEQVAPTIHRSHQVKNPAVASRQNTIQVIWDASHPDPCRRGIGYRRKIFNVWDSCFNPECILINTVSATQPTIAVNDFGRVYTSWLDFDEKKQVTSCGSSDIYAKTSDDYGETWNPEFNITDVDPLDYYQGLPDLAAKLSSDEAYIVWHGERITSGGTKYRIIFKKTTDGGVTWIPPLPNNGDILSDPDLTVDSENPKIAASVYRRYAVWQQEVPLGNSKIIFIASSDPPDDHPLPPANLTATPNDCPVEILLTWNENGESDMDHYNVYRKPDGGSFKLIANVPFPGPNYTDGDPHLITGETYTYAVTAVDNAGNESCPSYDSVIIPPLNCPCVVEGPPEETEPAVAWSEEEEKFLTVWKDFDGGINYKIMGIFQDANGNPQGTSFQISDVGHLGPRSSPAVDWDGSFFLVVWEDTREDATSNQYQIYGQWILGNGTLVGSDFKVVDEPIEITEDQRYPDLAWSGTSYLVTYRGFKASVSPFWDIYGIRVIYGANLCCGEFLITIESGTGGQPAERNQEHPAVDWDGTYFLVVWQDTREDPTNTQYQIYGQWILPDGTLYYDNFNVTSPSVYGVESEDQRYPDLAWDASSNYLVTYQAYHLGNLNIYGHQVSPPPQNICCEFLISDEVGIQERPAVASDDDCNWFVVWQDKRIGPKWDIYGQFVSSDFTLDGNNISIMPDLLHNQELPDIAWRNGISPGEDGKFLSVWQVDKTTPLLWDICSAVHNSKCQTAFAGGSPSGPQSSLAIPMTTQKVQLLNIPNPFSLETTVKFAVPNDGKVSLKIYNITGRLIKTMIDETFEAGSYTAKWNGSSDRGESVPNGVYFFRLTTSKGNLTNKIILLR